jgi:2-C-methyl-D-erythritol 4-phosphate cytidylyltransferase
MPDTRYTALVLAAARGGPARPAGAGRRRLAKAFIDLAGKPMLRRVVEGVIDSGRVGHVIVSIEREAMDEAKQVLAGLDGRVPITYTPSRESIAQACRR